MSLFNNSWPPLPGLWLSGSALRPSGTFCSQLAQSTFFLSFYSTCFLRHYWSDWHQLFLRPFLRRGGDVLHPIAGINRAYNDGRSDNILVLSLGTSATGGGLHQSDGEQHCGHQLFGDDAKDKCGLYHYLWLLLHELQRGHIDGSGLSLCTDTD